MLVNNKANYHLKKEATTLGQTFTGRNTSLPAGGTIVQQRDSYQGNDLEMIMDPSIAS